jgi:hypothetical protein
MFMSPAQKVIHIMEYVGVNVSFFWRMSTCECRRYLLKEYRPNNAEFCQRLCLSCDGQFLHHQFFDTLFSN